jgi:RNA polymerase sigma factor (sigma-70 family)
VSGALDEANGGLGDLGDPLRALRAQFGELVEPHRSALWRYCLRLTGNVWDAEDLLQETLAKAFARITLFWQALEPRAYLFRIASNTWIDTVRRARLAAEELDEAERLADPRAADPGETWSAMETLVGILPPRQRVVLLLMDVFDFKAAEVAPMAGMTEGAVYAALYRARDALARARSEASAPPAAETRAAGGGAAPATPATPALVSRFVDAFNRRDAQALAALLSPEISMGIVGLIHQEGHTAAEALLIAWARNPAPRVAEAGYLDGRHVIYLFSYTPEHERALSRVMWLDGDAPGEAAERVVRWHCYFFNDELLDYVAAQLAVPRLALRQTAETFDQLANMCRPPAEEARVSRASEGGKA